MGRTRSRSGPGVQPLCWVASESCRSTARLGHPFLQDFPVRGAPGAARAPGARDNRTTGSAPRRPPSPSARLAAPRPARASSATSSPSAVPPSTPARAPSPSRSGPRRLRALRHPDRDRLGRAPLRRPCQLLTQIRPALFCPRCPANGRLQPPHPIHVGPSRAAHCRRAKSGSDVGAGATRVRPGAADAPARPSLGAERVGHPGAARRRGRVSSRRPRVA